MSEFWDNRRRVIREYCEQTGKYAPDAYEFVTTGVIEQVEALDTPRHLSALEVLQNLRSRLDAEFGLLMPAVLERWQIRTASDIGEIVFDLIKMNILSASADDKRSDFDVDFNLQTTEKTVRKSLPVEVPKID